MRFDNPCSVVRVAAWWVCALTLILLHGAPAAFATENPVSGGPRELLREHFAEVLLELPRQEFPAEARALPLRLFEAAERIEITTNDLDGTLRTLMDARVPLTNLRIRPPNLEDLFLELTGKELRA